MLQHSEGSGAGPVSRVAGPSTYPLAEPGSIKISTDATSKGISDKA